MVLDTTENLIKDTGDLIYSHVSLSLTIVTALSYLNLINELIKELKLPSGKFLTPIIFTFLSVILINIIPKKKKIRYSEKLT